jgi:hypothetical protein
MGFRRCEKPSHECFARLLALQVAQQFDGERTTNAVPAADFLAEFRRHLPPRFDGVSRRVSLEDDGSLVGIDVRQVAAVKNPARGYCCP